MGRKGEVPRAQLRSSMSLVSNYNAVRHHCRGLMSYPPDIISDITEWIKRIGNDIANHCPEAAVWGKSPRSWSVHVICNLQIAGMSLGFSGLKQYLFSKSNIHIQLFQNVENTQNSVITNWVFLVCMTLIHDGRNYVIPQSLSCSAFLKTCR